MLAPRILDSRAYGFDIGPTLPRVQDLVATPAAAVDGSEFEAADNHDQGPCGHDCDVAGGLIQYEESHPYGTTAYRAGDSGIDVSPRRYRYTGMEQDEETGLGYHTARYYAGWLGRWTASDPIGLGGGVNRFGYCGGRPTCSRDPSGTAASDETWTTVSDVDDSGTAGMLGASRFGIAPPEPNTSGGVGGTPVDAQNADAQAVGAAAETNSDEASKKPSAERLEEHTGDDFPYEKYVVPGHPDAAPELPRRGVDPASLELNSSRSRRQNRATIWGMRVRAAARVRLGKARYLNSVETALLSSVLPESFDFKSVTIDVLSDRDAARVSRRSDLPWPDGTHQNGRIQLRGHFFIDGDVSKGVQFLGPNGVRAAEVLAHEAFHAFQKSRGRTLRRDSRRERRMGLAPSTDMLAYQPDSRILGENGAEAFRRLPIETQAANFDDMVGAWMRMALGIGVDGGDDFPFDAFMSVWRYVRAL